MTEVKKGINDGYSRGGCKWKIMYWRSICCYLTLKEKRLLRTQIFDNYIWTMLGIMLSKYAMATNDTDWRGHVVWYIQYFWREVEWVGRDREIDEELDKDWVDRSFSWLGWNYPEIVRGQWRHRGWVLYYYHFRWRTEVVFISRPTGADGIHNKSLGYGM